MKMDICRACMSDSHTLVDIFCDRPLPDYEFSLAEMLNELVDFKIDRNDKLPQKICVTCGLNAQIAFRFKRRLQQSHQLLCMKVMEYSEDVTVLDTDTDDEVKEIKLNEKPSKLQRQKMTSCEKQIAENAFSVPKDTNYFGNEYDQVECSTLDIAEADSARTHRYPLRQSTRRPNYCENIVQPVQLRSKLRMFKCDQCTVSFTTSNNLKKHQNSHDGQLKYKCLHCPEAYSNQSKLQKHIKIHRQKHRYLCELCSKAFKHQSSLNKHTVTHSSERPFICSYCEFAFKSYFYLKRHVRSHLGKRSFQCEACNKSFTTKWNLKCHINTPNRCLSERAINSNRH